MKEKVLMKGNEAFAEAAIRSGCRYYFGYPITPQNEIPEYMSRELPKADGEFVQAESELAAVNMAYGASAAGGRVLISSSSPGIALMQEGLSFMASVEAPCVIINVSRGGPGIGSIQPGQSDYFQATRGGGNGDYHLIVLAPASIQEAVGMMGDAFDLTDKYRNPVMILADGMIGQMMEPVVLPETGEHPEIDKPWALTGTEGKRAPNTIKSLYLKSEDLEKRNFYLLEKYETMKRNEVKQESIGLSDSEIIFVAYGSTSRIVKEAIEMLAKDGVKAGLIRPLTLWPYPYSAFDAIPKTVKAVVSVELSQGQMIDDVKIGVNGRFPVHFIGRFGGIIISPEEVVSKAKMILGGGENEDRI